MLVVMVVCSRLSLWANETSRLCSVSSGLGCRAESSALPWLQDKTVSFLEGLSLKPSLKRSPQLPWADCSKSNLCHFPSAHLL